MTSTATTSSTLMPMPPIARPAVEKHLSWEDFQRRYLEREDRFKYEWVRGMVEKTPRTMDQNQMLLVNKLEDFLASLQKKDPSLGKLWAEVDCFFAGAHRRPDLAYFSKKQIADIPRGNQTPQFVLEIVSKNDQADRVTEKLGDYRRAGVAVVWLIFPKRREIHVYHGIHGTICSGEQVASADAVIPGFALPASALFTPAQPLN